MKWRESNFSFDGEQLKKKSKAIAIDNNKNNK